CKEWLSTAPCG
nr:Chain P, PROTEIN (11-MER; CYCLIC PEPTIDE) [synthetic construct]